MFILLRGERILDTNYSCAYANPHLLRRVHLYLEDDMETETDKKQKRVKNNELAEAELGNGRAKSPYIIQLYMQ